jgi:hypothetical protein
MGISMANAEQTAQGLASLGRYGDTTLVHMKPAEVAGLQQLAEANGTTLTINPDTGMPEAFLGDFISSLLPTIAAAGVTAAFPGAAPYVAPMVGAGTTMLQGKTDPLEIAMGGLSGYGGGQIGNALTAPGTVLAGTADVGTNIAADQIKDQMTKQAVSNTIGASVAPGVTTAAVPGTTTGGLNAIRMGQSNVGNPLGGASPINQATPTGTMGYSNVGNPLGGASPINRPIPSPIGTNNSYGVVNENEFFYKNPKQPLVNESSNRFNTLTTAEQNMSPNFNSIPIENNFGSVNPNLDTNIGGANLNQGIKTGADAALGNLKKAGQGIVGAAREPLSFFEKVGGGEYVDAAGNIVNKGGEGSALYGGLKVAAPIAMAGAEGYYSDMYDGMNTPLTRGGPSGPLNLSDAIRPSMTLPMYAQGGMIPSYQAGGIAGLGYGGLLEGTGDGISDSIPARIDGSQEAALSKGEFVVPARIVSEIGNGSSDAGAERLYAMMDRVEKDRERTTGQGNIAVDTNAERRLPA